MSNSNKAKECHLAVSGRQLWWLHFKISPSISSSVSKNQPSRCQTQKTDLVIQCAEGRLKQKGSEESCLNCATPFLCDVFVRLEAASEKFLETSGKTNMSGGPHLCSQRSAVVVGKWVCVAMTMCSGDLCCVVCEGANSGGPAAGQPSAGRPQACTALGSLA